MKINKQAWLKAEAGLRTPPRRPPGGLTVEEYAGLREVALSRASTILRELHRLGIASRQKWGQKWIYQLKSNGKAY